MTGARPSDSSIVVLPFANLSGNPEDEYFSDGLAEEITCTLAQIDGLRVIARTSAFAFKGRNEDIREIAKILRVHYVIEGSVRRSATRIRVTVQLIHGPDGSHRLAKRYDREMTDIFALQDEISADIAAQLKVSLAPRQSTVNFPAFEFTWKAAFTGASILRRNSKKRSSVLNAPSRPILATPRPTPASRRAELA